MSPSIFSSAKNQSDLSVEEQALRDNLRRVVQFFGVVLLGGIGLAVAGLWSRYNPSAGIVAALWSAALAAIGTCFGFLFGIPKVLQSQGARPAAPPAAADPNVQPPADNPDKSPPLPYQQRVNTNLEEISDWITKIIVGLGLVSLRTIPARIHTLSLHIAASFAQPYEDGAGVATALVVFFVPTGFLFGYLLTRLFIQGAFGLADQAAVLAVAARARKTANWAVGLLQEQMPGLRDKLSIEGQDPLTSFRNLWMQDPNKGAFGGKPEANSRRLSATITPIENAASSQICIVVLTVESTDPQNKPLRGSVTFSLHPTFAPPERPVLVDQNGVATLQFDSAGRFTVGAVADNGATRLELDLADVPGGTAEFYAN